MSKSNNSRSKVRSRYRSVSRSPSRSRIARNRRSPSASISRSSSRRRSRYSNRRSPSIIRSRSISPRIKRGNYSSSKKRSISRDNHKSSRIRSISPNTSVSRERSKPIRSSVSRTRSLSKSRPASRDSSKKERLITKSNSKSKDSPRRSRSISIGSRSASPRSNSDIENNKRRSRRSDDEICTVVIRNISKNVREAHIEEIFEAYGKIQRVTIPIERKRIVSDSQRIAYIDYETHNEALSAIDYMDGATLDSLTLTVTLREPRKPRNFNSRSTFNGRRSGFRGRRFDGYPRRSPDRHQEAMQPGIEISDLDPVISDLGPASLEDQDHAALIDQGPAVIEDQDQEASLVQDHETSQGIDLAALFALGPDLSLEPVLRNK
ncbi:RNA-binding protein with serine-rich domain 1 [Smittium culicis]|uniref:RNA-binding protein with serine-rich domain 1 n=1 Tax=Smittium culicis TaxID=133412 RepID=A0A1R1YDU9_9FUNG|nr:RNA-binding protein with serine-rich domain 1 [Smittium culicis]